MIEQIVNLYVSIRIHQETMDRFGMSDSKHVATPMNRSYSELIQQESSLVNDVQYQQVIGSLIHPMIGSISDLAFAIGNLLRHAE